jgi:hypothetical protein
MTRARLVSLALLLGCSTTSADSDALPGAEDAASTTDASTSSTDADLPDGFVRGPDADTTTMRDAGGSAFALPPDDGGLDYQLGGAYTPPAGVAIVSRDRTASPASGLYNLCYVNGFQIQPGEEGDWMSAHPTAILRDAAGDPVIDVDWGETLVDTSTSAKRDEVLAMVGPWIDQCATDGFDAVEIDNLDSYSRSGGLLTEDENVLMIRMFADRAHAAGLAIAQKNSSELVPRRTEMGTDFVVAEECNRYSECDVYRGGYGEHVLMIEYRMADFTAGCAAYPQSSIVLRDVHLVPAGASGYVYDGC